MARLAGWARLALWRHVAARLFPRISDFDADPIETMAEQLGFIL